MPQTTITSQMRASTQRIFTNYQNDHRNLTEHETKHLNSAITFDCVALEIDTLDNLMLQSSAARVNLIIKAINPFHNIGLLSYTIDPVALQQYLDGLNSWRIERRQLSSALQADKILFLPSHEQRTYLKICAAAMGVDLGYAAWSFTVAHLEAICKGMDYEKIARLPEHQLKAVLLGERIEAVQDPRVTPRHLMLCKFQIPLKSSLAIDDQLLEHILTLFSAKLRTLSKNLPALISFNWLSLFSSLRSLADLYTNFTHLDPETQFKILAGLPEEQIYAESYSTERAYLYALGFALDRIQTFTNLETQAITLGIDPEKAISLQCSRLLLENIGSKILYNPDLAVNMLESAEFQQLLPLDTWQLAVSLYYQGADLCSYHPQEGHYFACMLLDNPSQEQVKAILTQSQEAAIGTALGLSKAQYTNPCFGETLFEILFALNLQLKEQGLNTEQIFAKTKQYYQAMQHLNGAQIFAASCNNGINAYSDFNEIESLIRDPSAFQDVREELLAGKYYASRLKLKQDLRMLKNLAIYQLEGIENGFSLHTVQEPWYREEYAVILKLFPGLFIASDFEPAAITALIAIHNLPAELQQAENLSCSHILAYLRNVPVQQLLTVNSEQALGMAFGLTVEQVKFDWFTATHALAIIPDKNEDASNLKYADIQELTPLQVAGMQAGLSRADVTGGLYCSYHLAALMLDYNQSWVKSADRASISDQVAKNYNFAICFDQFVEQHTRYLQDQTLVQVLRRVTGMNLGV